MCPGIAIGLTGVAGVETGTGVGTGVDAAAGVETGVAVDVFGLSGAAEVSAPAAAPSNAASELLQGLRGTRGTLAWVAFAVGGVVTSWAISGP